MDSKNNNNKYIKIFLGLGIAVFIIDSMAGALLRINLTRSWQGILLILPVYIFLSIAGILYTKQIYTANKKRQKKSYYIIRGIIIAYAFIILAFFIKSLL